MKKNILLIAFCLSTCISSAQYLPRELPAKQGMWDYPIKPGTEEWNKLQSNAEKVKVCQIPEGVLKSLPTEELTDLVLRYPLLGDFYAFNNPNDGLNKLFRDFNGIRELYKRTNVSTCLIRRYVEQIQSLPSLNDTTSNLRKGSFVIYVSELEGLLSRVEWQENNKESLKKVLQTLVTGYEKKLEYPDYFQGFGLRTNFFSRIQIIKKMYPSFAEQLQNKGKNIAQDSIKMSIEETINYIDEMSYQLIK